jgi:CRISPR/Cas system CSM-associated protein Csm2 small subunit
MANFTEQMQRIVEEYRGAGRPWPAAKEEIAEWAVAHDRYQLTRGMAISQCAEHLARAMRVEHVIDHEGRSVRKYYAARMREDGKQKTLWADLDADLPFMEVAVANRRQQIVGECRQLKTDVDSYNERRSPDRPIQVVFDFTTDLEELEQLMKSHRQPRSGTTTISPAHTSLGFAQESAWHEDRAGPRIFGHPTRGKPVFPE